MIPTETQPPHPQCGGFFASGGVFAAASRVSFVPCRKHGRGLPLDSGLRLHLPLPSALPLFLSVRCRERGRGLPLVSGFALALAVAFGAAAILVCALSEAWLWASARLGFALALAVAFGAADACGAAAKFISERGDIACPRL